MRISDWSSDVCSSDLLPCDDLVQRAPTQLNRIRAPFHLDHRRTTEVLGETCGVDGRRGDDDLQLRPLQRQPLQVDRKSVVSGKSVSVRVDLGGRRIIKKQTRVTTSLTK